MGCPKSGLLFLPADLVSDSWFPASAADCDSLSLAASVLDEDCSAELDLGAALLPVCPVPDAESAFACAGFDTSDAATPLLAAAAAAAAFGAAESDACESSALSLCAGKLGRRFSWGGSGELVPAVESEVS